MKILTVGAFKANFSKVIEWIREGEVVAVTYGKSKKIIGYFSQTASQNIGRKRKLGILTKSMKMRIRKDWEIQESEFLGIG